MRVEWVLPNRERKTSIHTHRFERTYWAMVLQGNAVQGVTLLDIPGQVDNILHLLSGGASPQPLSATWPQLIALPILLWQVVLWAIVSKQIGMTAIGRLHHGGWLEPIVLASTGHFFFTVLGRAETGLSTTFCSKFFGYISRVILTLREENTENMFEPIDLKQGRDTLRNMFYHHTFGHTVHAGDYNAIVFTAWGNGNSGLFIK